MKTTPWKSNPPAPSSACPGTTLTVADLAAMAIKRIGVGSALARLAYDTLVRAARQIQQEGIFTQAEDAMGFAELEAFFPGPQSR